MADRVDTRRDRGDTLGGVDTPAALTGMLAAIGLLSLISGFIAAGAATIPFQIDLLDEQGGLQELEIVGVIVALVVVFASFFVGGWAAGRMARFDGGINGLAVAFWFVALMIVLAAAGAFLGQEYNAFAQMEMPDWISQVDVDDPTVTGIVLALVGLAVMFLGGYLGGRVGEMYNRRVDTVVATEAAREERVRGEAGYREA